MSCVLINKTHWGKIEFGGIYLKNCLLILEQVIWLHQIQNVIINNNNKNKMIFPVMIKKRFFLL